MFEVQFYEVQFKRKGSKKRKKANSKRIKAVSKLKRNENRKKGENDG